MIETRKDQYVQQCRRWLREWMQEQKNEIQKAGLSPEWANLIVKEAVIADGKHFGRDIEFDRKLVTTTKPAQEG